MIFSWRRSSVLKQAYGNRQQTEAECTKSERGAVFLAGLPALQQSKIPIVSWFRRLPEAFPAPPLQRPWRGTRRIEGAAGAARGGSRASRRPPVSERGVVMRLWPGRLRSSSACTSSVVSSMLLGQPSMMQPTDLPWLSPQVVTRNTVPKVLPALRVTRLPGGPPHRPLQATIPPVSRLIYTCRPGREGRGATGGRARAA